MSWEALLKVTARFFAMYRELAGKSQAEVELPEGASVGDLLAKVKEQFPRLYAFSNSLVVAVNAEYVSSDVKLKQGDEVAFIPPVSGGAAFASITKEPIDPQVIAGKIRSAAQGAVVVFMGTVRGESNGRRVRHLEYDAYEEMAVKKLDEIAGEIAEKWRITDIAFCHRVGHMDVGEIAVVIAVGSAHRGEAFEACQHAIDRLKQIVPIWKKEVYEDGAYWVGQEGTAGAYYPANP